MRLKVKFEGSIDLDEEQIEFFNNETTRTKQSKINDCLAAIKHDFSKNLDYIKIKNISVEEESKL